MVGLHVIEYLLRVPWVWGFPWGFQWGFLWVWDGYGDWNAIPTAALDTGIVYRAVCLFTPMQLSLVLRRPTHRGMAMAELAWVSGYIPKWLTCLETITHPSSNRARRRLTSLMRQTKLPTKPNCHQLLTASTVAQLCSWAPESEPLSFCHSFTKIYRFSEFFLDKLGRKFQWSNDRRNISNHTMALLSYCIVLFIHVHMQLNVQ